jgi:hypothetical protein
LASGKRQVRATDSDDGSRGRQSALIQQMEFAPTDVGGYFGSGLQICREIIDAAWTGLVFPEWSMKEFREHSPAFPACVAGRLGFYSLRQQLTEGL